MKVQIFTILCRSLVLLPLVHIRGHHHWRERIVVIISKYACTLGLCHSFQDVNISRIKRWIGGCGVGVRVEKLKWCCRPSKFCRELFWYGNNIWTHNNDVDGPSCATPPHHHPPPPPQQHTLDGLVIIHESYQQQQRPYRHPIWIRRHAEDAVEILVHPPLFSPPPSTPLWTTHNTRTSSHRQQPSPALSAYLWPARRSALNIDVCRRK